MAYACVFCSASNCLGKSYIEETKRIGVMLASYGYDLVYGGDSAGLMGIISTVMKEKGSKIVGVCVEKIYAEGRYNKNCDEIIICENLSARKQRMRDIADIFIILPGGIGTIDELMEVISEKKLGFLNKSVIVYDSNNLFDSFFLGMDKLVKEKFAKPDIKFLWNKISDLYSLKRLLDKENNPKERYV